LILGRCRPSILIKILLNFEQDSPISRFNDLHEKLENLVVLAQSGDKAAYAEFLNLLYPYISSILRRKLGSIVDHEDLTQECLMGIHKNLASYHPSKPLKPWISAIIRYKVADHFKLLSKRKEQSLIDEDGNVTRGAENSNEPMGAVGHEVIEMLSLLPDKLRLALEMTQLDGDSYEEAAKKSGVSEVAIRKRVSRAYKELRRLVSQEMEIG